MKQNSKNERLAARIGGLVTAMVIAIAVIFSYGFKEKTDDLWKQLGIQQQEANTSIKESFLRGFLKYYDARNIKNIARGDKKAVTQDLLNYTKQFINTQFKAAYEKERIDFKPREPQLRPLRTKEQIQKDEVNKLEANIKKMESDMKTMNDDMKKIFEPGIEQNKKMLAEYKKPGYELFEMMAQGEKSEQERQVSNYKNDLKSWEERYPEDYRIVIKTRLQTHARNNKRCGLQRRIKGD